MRGLKAVTLKQGHSTRRLKGQNTRRKVKRSKVQKQYLFEVNFPITFFNAPEITVWH